MNPMLKREGPRAMSQHLFAADPNERISALFSIETEAKRMHSHLPATMLRRVERFAARGLPYYAPRHTAYRAWVAQAISYWEQLQSTAERNVRTVRQDGCRSHPRRESESDEFSPR